MKAFAALFTAIEQTTKTNAKIDALMNYFGSVPEQDVLWCVAILTGKTLKRNIKTAALKSWAAGVAGLPFWLFEESYHIVGDLAETITLCLPEPTATNDESLSDTILFLQSLATFTEEEKETSCSAALVAITDH